VQNTPVIQEALKNLDLIENRFGAESAEVGLFLMDLAELLESQGRLLEAEILAKRYRSILLKLAIESGWVNHSPRELG
jgi:hypothetical protein